MSDLALALLDACELGPWYRLPAADRRMLLMRGVSVCSLVLILRGVHAVGWTTMPSPGDSAAHFLLTIGPAQLAYQDQNLDKVYGNFTALQLTGYIEPDLTPDTVIPGYRLDLVRSEPYYGPGCGGDSSFTMVALPRARRLRTFAMCDDQTLRWCDNQAALLPCRWTPVEREIIARLREKTKKEVRN